jgi:Zn-dependent protease with chaperone function
VSDFDAGSLRGAYFDGRTSAASPVEIRIEAGSMLVQGDGVARAWPLDGVRIAPRIGNAARTIDFPDGAACEVRDNDGLDRLLRATPPPSRAHRAIHLLESRLKFVAAAVALTVLVGWASIQYGVPWLAREVAHALPRDVDTALGEGALEGMDQLFFERSQVDRAVRPRLRAKFAELARAAMLEAQPRLEFRASPDFGANAFALPSGIVVVTDELVASASDEELVAVLAHELGHIHHRHALRGVLQNAITPLLLAAVTGDVSVLVGTMPTLLIDMKYSRLFELEADDFAVELLDRQGIPRHHLADILARMTSTEESDAGLGHYLSSHPATSERIERINRR